MTATAKISNKRKIKLFAFPRHTSTVTSVYACRRMSQLKTDSVSQKTSVQLSVRGRPTAFDMCASNDMAVVVSAGCMTFFHLNGLGAPCHVIHYEQNELIEKVKFQKEGHIAGMRGGVVSIWDPMHSLRPLVGFVKSTGR